MRSCPECGAGELGRPPLVTVNDDGTALCGNCGWEGNETDLRGEDEDE